MAGFADIHDDDLIPAQEVAERMGYARWSSLARWLQSAGLPMPVCQRRGWYRGERVKEWFRRIDRTTRPPPPVVAPPPLSDDQVAQLRRNAHTRLRLVQ